MKNVLLDQHLTYLNQPEFSSYLKDYAKIFAVGIDIKATSFDENCANFCLDRDCDFLTTDKKSYDHFFRIRQVKSVEVFQFMKKEPNIDRPVYCMRIKLDGAKIKIITKEQMNALQVKTSGNVSRMLDFLYKVIGEPSAPRKDIPNVHVYECYAIFTHAVEEYGKLLYLRSTIPDANGNYTIEYSKKFTNHKVKFELALTNLPESITTVYLGSFDSKIFGNNTQFGVDTKVTWENRLNILNTDIDDDGNPTDISFNVDIDKLRQCISDFRSIPK